MQSEFCKKHGHPFFTSFDKCSCCEEETYGEKEYITGCPFVTAHSVIRVKDKIDMAFSHSDGLLIRSLIARELKTSEVVVVDFAGVEVFTPVFFNYSISYFIFTKSVDWCNEHIRFINLSRLGISLFQRSVRNALGAVEE